MGCFLKEYKKEEILPNPIATHPSLFSSPLCCPVRLVLSPFLFVARKVKEIFQSFLGYFVRIGVFSFGEWNRSWIKRKIITIYNDGIWGLFSGGKFCPLRLDQAFYCLERAGGIRSFTYSKDGTKLDTMLIRYKDVKATIEKNGGKIVQSFPINNIEQKKEGQNLVTYCRENRA